MSSLQQIYESKQYHLGLEFLAKPYDEPTMFRFAYAFEQATKHRHPPASAPEL